jgi:hypothetical protein
MTAERLVNLYELMDSAYDGRALGHVPIIDVNPRRDVALKQELAIAPVKLGRLEEGGLLVQARGKTWAQLVFQDFVKFENK